MPTHQGSVIHESHQLAPKALATLVAGGLLLPSRLSAAGLGANLVVNGDFENVNVGVTGEFNGPLVLHWTGPNLFAYSHDGSSSSAGAVPDFADGANPPNAGHWYFTSNNTNAAFSDVHDPNVFYQDIDISIGVAAAQITAGTATYRLAAYMSSYLNDADYGNVLAQFRDAANAVISAALIADVADSGVNNVWSLNSTTGLVPVGTASVRVSLFGTKASGVPAGGADGYIDNVEFQIVPEPSSIVSTAMGSVICLSRSRRRRK
jgi:hypothetical protein